MPYAIILSSFVNSNLNSTLYLQFTHYSGCWFRYMRVKNNVFFFTLVYARTCISMSQLKTAWPNTFFGRFTQHSLAQSSGEKNIWGIEIFPIRFLRGVISRECSNLGTFWDILGALIFTDISVC